MDTFFIIKDEYTQGIQCGMISAEALDQLLAHALTGATRENDAEAQTLIKRIARAFVSGFAENEDPAS